MWKLIGEMDLVKSLSVAIIFFVISGGNAEDQQIFEAPFPCNNDIFCYGDIIHTVQRARLAPTYDSKSFVDMKLKFPPHVVKSNFQYMLDQQGPHPSKAEVDKFVSHNFDPAGTEFEPWVPQDWKANPAFLSSIRDDKLREFASELNAFWKVLGRQIKKDVCTRPDYYSMICVDNPLIVPGGRFIEFYYWDQFWIMKGLLHSQMTSTVRGMLENFFQMVEKIGYIPNGGRIYYERSQPPLLIPMVQDYFRATDDAYFVKHYISTLDKEFNFWMTNRTYELDIGGVKHTVARYNVELGNPRPEAYNPDYDLASELTSQQDQRELYMHLKTAAESGLDFSSRWFIPEDLSADVGKLKDIKARYVMPVDLNVLLYRNAKIMASLHRNVVKNETKAKEYDAKAAQWNATIQAVFWNETEGAWFDYVDTSFFKGHKIEFYPGNVLPLIMGETSQENVERVLDFLDREGVLKFPGGIPSSLHQTGEQWDFPNAWAPHVHWFIESLEGTGHPRALQLAKEQASNWVANNYLTYISHNNTMFEKYDVQNVGSAGGGGEYEVVIGFGWSNGAVMDMMSKYGDTLVAPEGGDDGDTTTHPSTDETGSTDTDESTLRATTAKAPSTSAMMGFVYTLIAGLCLALNYNNY